MNILKRHKIHYEVRERLRDRETDRQTERESSRVRECFGKGIIISPTYVKILIKFLRSLILPS